MTIFLKNIDNILQIREEFCKFIDIFEPRAKSQEPRAKSQEPRA